MILAINSQNTYTYVGCIDECGAVKHVFHLPTDQNETEFGYAAKIKEIYFFIKIPI